MFRHNSSPSFARKLTLSMLAGLLAVSAMIPTAALAGRRGGPGFNRTRVLAYDTDQYCMVFYGDEIAEIIVDGDGDTDLDLYVYDENGNLIASDTDYTDYCVVRWCPAWTGQFTVRVVNLGSVWNEYTLRTN